MIELTDKLIAVIVPDEYNKFKISGTNYLCGAEQTAWQALPPRLDVASYNIIGTVNLLGEFDFDCEKYILCTDLESHKLFGDGKWKNYNSEYPYYHETKEESFISLLESKNVKLENLNNQKLLILEKK
jgi:hypothetical protein